MNTRSSRRDLLVTASLSTAAVLTTRQANAQSRPAPDAGAAGRRPFVLSPPVNLAVLTGTHQVVPLPFAPRTLRGLSEAMITSHHQNNYSSAVRNLNRAEQELSRIASDTPGFVVSSLRERELNFRNSKTLHEAYFGNLGGDGRRSGAIETLLAQSYTTSTRWEEHFRATGAGLGGGSGWVILALELETGALRTVASTGHTQALCSAVPLLVMDMYEHSYAIDFGAAVPRYLDAFFANIKWDEVNRRLERAQRAATILRS